MHVRISKSFLGTISEEFLGISGAVKRELHKKNLRNITRETLVKISRGTPA